MNAHHHWALAALSVAVIGPTSLSHAAPVSGQGTWETTLQGRDLDGNLATAEAYYDTVLDITWLADANHAMTTSFDADGLMDWTTANNWAAGLNPYSSDITGWRLPDTNPVDGVAFDYSSSSDGSTDHGYNISAPDSVYPGSTGSEMAYMYYNNLGNLGFRDITGMVRGCPGSPTFCLTNTGPFSNVQPLIYWSAKGYAPDTSNAWLFFFADGFQTDGFKSSAYYAWAVHSGDVGASTVPVPAAMWLFGSGLLGLFGFVRRKAT
jgi:hypothetical protein